MEETFIIYLNEEKYYRKSIIKKETDKYIVKIKQYKILIIVDVILALYLIYGYKFYTNNVLWWISFIIFMTTAYFIINSVLNYDYKKLVATDFKIDKYIDTIDGFIRFECEIKKKKLRDYYN